MAFFFSSLVLCVLYLSFSIFLSLPFFVSACLQVAAILVRLLSNQAWLNLGNVIHYLHSIILHLEDICHSIVFNKYHKSRMTGLGEWYICTQSYCILLKSCHNIVLSKYPMYQGPPNDPQNGPVSTPLYLVRPFCFAQRTFVELMSAHLNLSQCNI